MTIEPPDGRPAGPVSFLRDLTFGGIGSAVVGFVFAASGPLAVILAAGTKGRLGEAELASWVFGAFFLNGIVSIAFSLLYRIPLVFFWTIPGTVLVGPALAHLSLAEVTGAYLAAGVLMLLLGLSGLVRRSMEAVPMPIVMGMVAGVFLQFGLDWVQAFRQDVTIAAPMTAVFLVLSAFPAAARVVPPLLAALVVGLAVPLWTGAFAPSIDLGAALAEPKVVMPELSWPALAELTLPLVITVLVVQNGQGIAVLTSAGHQPPVNSIAAACGVASIAGAFIGSVSTCLTGPVNAILSATGERGRQYASGVLVGLLAMGFGLVAPFMTRFMLSAPPAFIATLAGLAMLRILQASFAAAFKGPFGFGAVVTFLITVAGIPIAGIGAPFWGLVLGYLASRIIERGDFTAAKAGRPE